MCISATRGRRTRSTAQAKKTETESVTESKVPGMLAPFYDLLSQQVQGFGSLGRVRKTFSSQL